MIILSFKLEKANFKNWSNEFGYFSFTGISRAEERDVVFSFEKLVKKYFKIDKSYQVKVSENEFQKIRKKLSNILQNSKRKSAKLELNETHYHLTMGVEDQSEMDTFKCLLGDSSFAFVNKEDFF